tara:strand:- start:148 stop:813 length:666 start_codon:yes stop_codon:yes gene_type:complete
MSLIGDAFDNTVSLNETQVIPFKEVEPVVPTIDEPLYINSTVESARSASAINKRLNGLKITEEFIPPVEKQDNAELHEMLPFLARITGHVEIGTHKWKYSWQAVIRNNTSSDEGADEGEENDSWSNSGLKNILSSSGDNALNIMEAANTEDCVAPGVCMDCDYPEGWSPRAIGSCTSGNIQPIVVMFQQRIAGGMPTYIFQAENAHDGTCPDGADDGPIQP